MARRTTLQSPLYGYLPASAVVMKPKRAARSEVPVDVTHTAPTTLQGPMTLVGIREELGDCTRCKLCKTRTHIVFGEGNAQAQILFVGEGPGEQEDLSGRPFVGRAGQLLTKMIEAMGLKREDVYIANVVKCRPPGNRYPEPDEAEACRPFLIKQIATIQPKIVVSLGKCATQALMLIDTPISKMRGQFQDWNGVKVMPTYHPSYLLRNPAAKKDVWEDLKKVCLDLGLKIPKKEV